MQGTGVSDREFELVSVVGVFDPMEMQDLVKLGPTEIEAIEESLGEMFQVGQVINDRGSGSDLVIRRLQIDLLIQDGRFEVRSQGPSFSSETAQKMVELFSEVVSRFGSVPWTQLGYNFILRLSSSDTAIEKLGSQMLKDSLASTLQHEILGGAAWLWLEVQGSTLWLKLEPHRNSRTTRRVYVNANFTVELPDPSGFPGSAIIKDKLLSYRDELDSILKALEL